MLKLDPLKMLIYTSHDFQNNIYLCSQFPNVAYLLKQLNWKVILIHLFVSILINNN